MLVKKNTHKHSQCRELSPQHSPAWLTAPPLAHTRERSDNLQRSDTYKTLIRPPLESVDQSLAFFTSLSPPPPQSIYSVWCLNPTAFSSTLFVFRMVNGNLYLLTYITTVLLVVKRGGCFCLIECSVMYSRQPIFSWTILATLCYECATCTSIKLPPANKMTRLREKAVLYNC